MMQFYMGSLVLLGVTKGNIDKLKDGQPILFEFRGKKPPKSIAIVYGEDKLAILDFLHKEYEFQIPIWMRKEAEEDPS